MLEITAQVSMLTEALSGLVTHCQVKITSLAVNGSPSLQSTPSLSVKVTLVRSSETVPSSVEGTAVARTGASVPSCR